MKISDGDRSGKVPKPRYFRILSFGFLSSFVIRHSSLARLAAALAIAAGYDGRSASSPGEVSSGIVIEQSDLALLQDQATTAVKSAPTRTLKSGGLIGVLGGARVKLLSDGAHEVLLPMPQLSESQIPLCYAITSTPREAGKEYRIGQRLGSNAVVTVRLQGPLDQEVQLDWSSIILVADRPFSPDRKVPPQYLQETPCVQSGARSVRALAERLWPADGRVDQYAANIQEFIRGMKQEKQPRSLDALAILESGANWICTANANLAAALLRSKNICARSIAVIPPTGQHLEMHRIVEYSDGGPWHAFDPSSLQKDIPLKPWQNVVMARATLADEEMAMKPRLGSALGCPYGQELEMLDSGITLWGKDFFWTMSKPLVGFEPSDPAVNAARMEWRRFLDTGKLSPTQIKAASATDNAALLEALGAKGRESDGAANRSQPVRPATNSPSAPAGSPR
jgi:hypothetical protein